MNEDARQRHGSSRTIHLLKQNTQTPAGPRTNLYKSQPFSPDKGAHMLEQTRQCPYPQLCIVSCSSNFRSPQGSTHFCLQCPLFARDSGMVEQTRQLPTSHTSSLSAAAQTSGLLKAQPPTSAFSALGVKPKGTISIRAPIPIFWAFVNTRVWGTAAFPCWCIRHDLA